MKLPPIPDKKELTLQQQNLERDLTQCVRCAVCLPTCPTFQLTLDEGHSPRGRISLVRAMHEGMANETPGMKKYLDACLQCRACETACPNNVIFHKVIEYGHERVDDHVNVGPVARFFKWLFLKKVFASTKAFDRFMALLRFYQKSGLQWLMRKTRLLYVMPWNLGKLERMYPARLGKHRPTRQKRDILLVPAGEIRGEVNFFTGCIADHWLQNSAHAVLKLLLHMGYKVHIPSAQQCCGALHAHLGSHSGAKKLALLNMNAFGDNDYPIVLHAAGCGAMLKDYKDMFSYGEHEGEARMFAGRVVDFSQILAGGLGRLNFDTALDKRITWDDPCHLIHAQGVKLEPRKILKSLPGVKYIELKEASWCCGSAGVYNVVHHDWSMEFLKRKIKHVADSEAEVLVTANPGCYLQLRLGVEIDKLDLQVQHLAEVVNACISKEPTLSDSSGEPPWK